MLHLKFFAYNAMVRGDVEIIFCIDVSKIHWVEVKNV